MKKFLVLLVGSVLFIACDFAEESTELGPDIELVYMNPVAWTTWETDTMHYATIEEIAFVARNSVDAHIEKMVWEYYDANDNLYFGTFETAIYLKIPGLVGGECECDTVILLGVPLPLDTVRSYAYSQKIYDARAEMRFIATDDYGLDEADTVEAWFGFQITPP